MSCSPSVPLRCCAGTGDCIMSDWTNLSLIYAGHDWYGKASYCFEKEHENYAERLNLSYHPLGTAAGSSKKQSPGYCSQEELSIQKFQQSGSV
jgi:hypothetical protein